MKNAINLQTLSGRLIILAITCIAFASCQTVKPYEKIYLNDRDMSMGISKESRYEKEFESYREGAAGGVIGKSGGGCGCN